MRPHSDKPGSSDQPAARSATASRPGRWSRVSRFAGVVAFVAGVVCAGATKPAQASPPPACTPATATASADYFDRAVSTSDQLPGVVVSVVSGTRTVFTRGYGKADVAKNIPMDPDRSLVRIASITKLFTATAVMQQVEAGHLDLDEDVNTYLTAFKIPRTYPQPITLQMLLSHTAGFEDRMIGTGARTAADVVPLEKYLAENMPARIRPPGVVSAYSNYGAALAGYLVTKVSGEPWDAYVQKHILAPLGMAHTTASEPLPAALASDLARSYRAKDDPIPFAFDQLTPDGSISATASDLAKFMIAHLDEGAHILKPETAALLHTRSFSADPRVGGYAHGFMNRTFNGHRVLMHDGGWEGFVSALVLVPDCELGVFLSANSVDASEALGDVLNGFFDRFAPGSETVSGSERPVPPQPGFYTPTRRNLSSVEKLITLLGPMRLTVTDSGSVRFKGKMWTPQSNGSYRADDDHLVVADGGRYVVTDGPAYERLDRAETPAVNLGVLAGFAIVASSALVVPVTAVWRGLRHRGGSVRRGEGTRRAWRVSRGLAVGAALLGGGFLVGLAAVLFSDTSAFLYGVPASFRALLVLPILVVLLAFGAMGTAVVGWRGAGVATRAHQVVLLAGLLAFVWFCGQWNLLGWQFT